MKIKIFLLFIVPLLILSACTQGLSIMNFSSENYVSLCDYQQITVEKSYLEISDREVENIIEAELSTNEVYAPILERTIPEIDDIVLLSFDGKQEYYFVGSGDYSSEFDQALLTLSIGDCQTLKTREDIVQTVELKGIYRLAQINDTSLVFAYYGYDSLDKLAAFIRQRAKEEILFHYALDIILKQSLVFALPDELEEQVALDIQNAKEYIVQEYASFEDYLNENNMTEETFTEQMISWYYEPMIYKAILDAENIRLTDKEMQDFQMENQLENYDDYEIYNQLAQQKVRKILLSTIKIIE